MDSVPGGNQRHVFPFCLFHRSGGRTGLGYRDTAQDAMTIPHSIPENAAETGGIMQVWYQKVMDCTFSSRSGLFLTTRSSPSNPLVIPTPNKDDYVHGLLMPARTMRSGRCPPGGIHQGDRELISRICSYLPRRRGRHCL